MLNKSGLDKSGNASYQANTPLNQSTLGDYDSRELSLNILMKIDMSNQEQVQYVIEQMKVHRAQKKPYKSFMPIKRLKGTVKKVHRLGMNTYSRFIYVNPIEGVLISY